MNLGLRVEIPFLAVAGLSGAESLRIAWHEIGQFISGAIAAPSVLAMPEAPVPASIPWAPILALVGIVMTIIGALIRRSVNTIDEQLKEQAKTITDLRLEQARTLEQLNTLKKMVSRD